MLGRLWNEYGDLCFQGSGFAAAAAGSYAAARYFKTTHVPSEKLKSTAHLKSDPALSKMVLEFQKLSQGDRWSELVSTVDECLELSKLYDSSTDAITLHELNRAVQHAIRLAEAMAKESRGSGDNEILETCVVVTEEHLPALVEALETLLQNGLMKY
jgi:hypothetical protein